jgi:hypothetical protein
VTETRKFALVTALGAMVSVMTVAGSGVASAATISFTQSYAPQTPAFTDLLTLNLFNSNLGALTGVELTLGTMLSGTVQILNITGSSQTFTNAGMEITVPITATGPGSVTASVSSLMGDDPSGTIGASLGPYDFTVSSAIAMGSAAVPFADFASYEHPGGGNTLDALVVTAPDNIKFFGTSVPGTFFGGIPFDSGTVTVTYTYTTSQTPLPGALSLFAGGLGLLGFTGLAKRRKTRGLPLTSV